MQSVAQKKFVTLTAVLAVVTLAGAFGMAQAPQGGGAPGAQAPAQGGAGRQGGGGGGRQGGGGPGRQAGAPQQAANPNQVETALIQGNVYRQPPADSMPRSR